MKQFTILTIICLIISIHLVCSLKRQGQKESEYALFSDGRGTYLIYADAERRSCLKCNCSNVTLQMVNDEVDEFTFEPSCECLKAEARTARRLTYLYKQIRKSRFKRSPQFSGMFQHILQRESKGKLTLHRNKTLIVS